MQISRLFGFSYLVLCSVEKTYWTANARIISLEIQCSDNQLGNCVTVGTRSAPGKMAHEMMGATVQLAKSPMQPDLALFQLCYQLQDTFSRYRVE